MTDIAERLREGAGYEKDDPLGVEQTMREAADEIERLHEELADVRADAELLRAEIQRLQEALQSLTHDPPSSLACEPDADCEVILKMRAIARRALEHKP